MAPTAAVDAPAAFPTIGPGIPAGYLGKNLPDSLRLLPPPPAMDSAGFGHDQAVHDAAQALKGTPRYALATADADLRMPHATSTFQCALGMAITQADTPRLYLLMQRVMVARAWRPMPPRTTTGAYAPSSITTSTPAWLPTRPPCATTVPIPPAIPRWAGPGGWYSPNWPRIAPMPC